MRNTTDEFIEWEGRQVKIVKNLKVNVLENSQKLLPSNLSKCKIFPKPTNQPENTISDDEELVIKPVRVDIRPLGKEVTKVGVFYGSDLFPELSERMVRCVGARESKELPLTGRCVASLRRLRLGRDGRDGPTDKARMDRERFTVMGRDEGESQQEEMPKLDKVTVSCEMELEGTGDMLGMTMDVVGQDVIGGLMDLVEMGIIDKPAPMWVANLPTAGRNKFHEK